MPAAPSAARAAHIALLAFLNLALGSAEEAWSHRDFLFPAPQAPFKFIDLPEPCACTTPRVIQRPDPPRRFATAGGVEADNSVVYPQPGPVHVLDMGVHPPLFVVAPLPGHPQYAGSEEADAKWRLLGASTPAKITSQLCLLPAGGLEEPMPVALHADDSSLFYVDAPAAAAHGGGSDDFDFSSRDLLCFEESVWFTTGLGSNCKQRAGVTPPHTCYSITRLPPQFLLKFDSRGSHSEPLRLRSRVLYKAIIELTVTIDHPRGEPSIIELFSPIFFTAFRQKINFAYLVQAEGPFVADHLETSQSLALVAQWRHNTTQPNSFYLPNRFLFPYLKCPAQTRRPSLVLNSTVNEGRNELYATDAQTSAQTTSLASLSLTVRL